MGAEGRFDHSAWNVVAVVAEDGSLMILARLFRTICAVSWLMQINADVVVKGDASAAVGW